MRYAPITERTAGLGSDMWAVHMHARKRQAAGEDIVMLSIGEPDMTPPPEVMEQAIASLRAGRATYSDGRGEANVLEAIAAKYTARTGRAVSRDQVIFMPGTQSALFAAIMTTVTVGDEIIVPDPFYVTYSGIIAASGARQMAAHALPENRFHLTPADLEAAITPKTRVLLLNSPNNPTGAVLSADEIAALGTVCKKHDLWIIADEVYESLVFGDVRFASAFDNPALAERTIVTSSLSKSHAMTGYRAGWIVASEEFCERALPIAEAMLFGCQPFIQDAAALALSQDFEVTAAMREAFEARAGRAVAALGQTNAIDCVMPEGGMFLFADVRASGLSGNEFAHRLLDEAAVAVMPGEAFGEAGNGHIRIGLTIDDERFDEAIARIANFANKLS